MANNIGNLQRANLASYIYNEIKQAFVIPAVSAVRIYSPISTNRHGIIDFFIYYYEKSERIL